MKELYADINIQLDENEKDNTYRLTFFKDCHWHGDIIFNKDGTILYNDLNDD